jgi:predicted esterase
MDAKATMTGLMAMLAMLSVGCTSAPTPAAGVGGGGGQAATATGPDPARPASTLPRLAPAAPAAPTVTVAPAPANTAGMPTGAKVLDLSVAGDPSRVVLPPGAGDGTRRPAMVFLHGHGMDQTQLTERTGLADAAAREGWISAAGAFGGRAHWGNDRALRGVGDLVKELVEKYGADPARIYLVGFSMGGGTALLAAANPLGLPYEAAAVVSSQGFTDLKAMTTEAAAGGAYARSIADAYGGQPSETDFQAHSPQAQAQRLVGVPVYLEHGEADRSVPPSHTRDMAAKLQALGASPVVHLYPAMGHGEQTIAEASIMAFLRGKVAP